jgi:hypothetical protein
VRKTLLAGVFVPTSRSKRCQADESERDRR